MTDWIKFRYGPRDVQQAMKYSIGGDRFETGVDPTVTGKRVILWISDKGFDNRQPSDLYNAGVNLTVQRGILDHITLSEGAADERKVMGISMWLASHTYNGVGFPAAYNAGTTYTEGDTVAYNSLRYRYINGADDSGNLPTDEEFWREITPNCITHPQYSQDFVDASDPGTGQPTRGYNEAGHRDIYRMLQHLHQYQDWYGINPAKIVIAGSSAGAIQALAVAFASGEMFAGIQPAGSNPYGGFGAVRPAGVFAYIAPEVMVHSHYDDVKYPTNLFGRRFTADIWNNMPANFKKACFPKWILEETQQHVPVLFHHHNNGAHGDQDHSLHSKGPLGPPPVYGLDGDVHHADNNWEWYETVTSQITDPAVRGRWDFIDNPRTTPGVQNLGDDWAWYVNGGFHQTVTITGPSGDNVASQTNSTFTDWAEDDNGPWPDAP